MSTPQARTDAARESFLATAAAFADGTATERQLASAARTLHVARESARIEANWDDTHFPASFRQSARDALAATRR